MKCQWLLWVPKLFPSCTNSSEYLGHIPQQCGKTCWSCDAELSWQNLRKHRWCKTGKIFEQRSKCVSEWVYICAWCVQIIRDGRQGMVCKMLAEIDVLKMRMWQGGQWPEQLKFSMSCLCRGPHFQAALFIAPTPSPFSTSRENPK